MSSQNRLLPNSRLLLFAITGAVGYLLFANLDSESFTIRTIRSAMGDAPLPARIVTWDQMDHVAHEAARSAESGNLLADLPDAQSTDQRLRQMTSMFYSRAVYALWPKRIFVADPSTIINTSTQLSATTLPTDAHWMTEHDIRAVVRFRTESDGVRIERANLRNDPPQ